VNDVSALLFDFDGLILDTETPKFETWNEVYLENGVELSLQDWALCLGTSDTAFDAADHLAKLTGKTFNRDALLADFYNRSLSKINRESPLPGVVALIEHARQNDLALGLASSSPRRWVLDHMQRLKLASRFDCILCREDSPRVKPDPELYLLLMQRLGVSSAESIAFEDSPNWIAAARLAGVYCVGVPNQVSRHLNLSLADLILPSLAELPPGPLLAYIDAQRRARIK